MNGARRLAEPREAEFSQLFGPAEMRRLLFAYRPSELQLNRRQRARELMRLNRLADEHEPRAFHDPDSAAHHELVEIVQRLARVPKARPGTKVPLPLQRPGATP